MVSTLTICFKLSNSKVYLVSVLVLIVHASGISVGIPGRHDVVVVQDLDERLDL
jgi:hypothetical protein